MISGWHVTSVHVPAEYTCVGLHGGGCGRVHLTLVDAVACLILHQRQARREQRWAETWEVRRVDGGLTEDEQDTVETVLETAEW